MFDTILFVDFDGTITCEDTLEGSMRLCIDPLLYAEKAQEMLSGKSTLAETLHIAFDHIPCSRLPEILAYVRTAPIRPGFEELLDRAEALSIPVVVISGGLNPYVEEKLKPYRSKLLAVHSVETDCGGEHIRLRSEYEADGEIMQKTLVMALYDYKKAICIGDGHTDVRMALASQAVFARDTLAAILQKRGIPFEPWQDFYEVARIIGISG